MKKTITIVLTIAVITLILTTTAFAWAPMIMGKPQIKAGKDNGMFFWLDKEGLHVRVTSPKKTVYTGALVFPVNVDVTGTPGVQKGDFVKKFKGPSYISASEIKDFYGFIGNLKEHKTASWKRIWQLLPDNSKKALTSYKKGKDTEKTDAAKVLNGVNNVILKKTVYDANAFKGVKLNAEAQGFIKKGVKNLSEEENQRLNRLLIEAVSGKKIIHPSMKEMIKFKFVVSKDVKGFDFKTKSPYLDFLPCKMNGKLVKRTHLFSGKKKQNLEHTPFRIYDIGNPNARMPFPH